MQYDLTPYAGKYVVLSFSAEAKRNNAGGPMVMQLNDGDHYPEVGGVFHNVGRGVWHKMQGIWAGWLRCEAPHLYLTTWHESANQAVYEVRDWVVEVKPLDLDNDTLLDRTGYSAYLAGRKTNEKLTHERIGLLDRLNAVLVSHKVTTLEDVTDAEIRELISPWNISGRANFLHNISKFLYDYATFAKKHSPAQLPLAHFIEDYYRRKSIKQAVDFVARKRARMLPLPTDFVVDPAYLADTGLDNTTFVEGFKELHALVIRCYEDIVNDPIAWGYPDTETTEGYLNRVLDVLFAIGLCGVYENRGITVNGAAFFALNSIKRHKKLERMVAQFAEMGLCFEGYDKKAVTFRVEYPDNAAVLAVLRAYTTLIETTKNDWQWEYLHPLSHRFVQKPDKYPAIWHYQMDYATSNLREIQTWLFDEAAKYGFTVAGMNKGCISYKKGSKEFLLVKNEGTKVSFIHAFARAPEKMQALCDRFPDVFRLDDSGMCCGDEENAIHQFGGRGENSKPRCAFVMQFEFNGVAYKRCGLGNFIFNDVTLEDVQAILEMYLVENKIKPV